MTRNVKAIGLASVALAALAVAATAVTATGRSPERLPVGSEPVELDLADFNTTIDNLYHPLTPGDRRVYRKTALDGQTTRVVEVVTKRTRLIANGIKARVVHVTDSVDGKLVEETFDWYAQDRAGNVWYLGEDTTYHKNGHVIPRKD